MKDEIKTSRLKNKIREKIKKIRKNNVEIVEIYISRNSNCRGKNSFYCENFSITMSLASWLKRYYHFYVYLPKGDDLLNECNSISIMTKNDWTLLDDNEKIKIK